MYGGLSMHILILLFFLFFSLHPHLFIPLTPDGRLYQILILILPALVLLVMVTVIGVFIAVLRRKAKQHTSSLTQSRAVIAFQNLSGEQDLPFYITGTHP